MEQTLPSQYLREASQELLAQTMSEEEFARMLVTFHPAVNGVDQELEDMEMPQDFEEGAFLEEQLQAALDQFVEGLQDLQTWMRSRCPELLEDALERCSEADLTIWEISQELQVEQFRQCPMPLYG